MKTKPKYIYGVWMTAGNCRAYTWESTNVLQWISGTCVEWACELYDIPKHPKLKSFRIVIRENPEGDWRTAVKRPMLRNTDTGMVGCYECVGFESLPLDTRYDLWIEYHEA